MKSKFSFDSLPVLLLCLITFFLVSSCLSPEWKEHGFVKWGNADTPENAYAEQWIDLGFKPEVAVKWRDAGFTAKESKAFIGEGFEAAEAKGWIDSGFLDPAVASEWKASGFLAKEAKRWSKHLGNPEEAATWRDIEIQDPKDVKMWKEAQFDPESSLPWIQVGFKDPNAARLWKLSSFDPGIAIQWEKFAFRPDSAAPWMSQGVNPAQAREMVRYKVKPSFATRYVWLRKKGLSPEKSAPWVEDFEPETALGWISARINVPDAKIYQKADFKPKDASLWQRGGFAASEAVEWENQEFSITDANLWRKGGFSALQAGLWQSHGYSPESAKAAKACGHPSLAKELEKLKKPLVMCLNFEKDLVYLSELPSINAPEAVADLAAWNQGCFHYNETRSDRRKVRPLIQSLREKKRFFYEAKLTDDSAIVFGGASYKRFFVKPDALNKKSFVHHAAFKRGDRIAGYFKSILDNERLVLQECFF